MADGSTTLTLPIPADALARLKRAEVRQRAETKKRGLTAVPVSVEGLLLIQRFICGCGCEIALDFTTPWDEAKPPESYPVIAHVLARGSRGDHTPRNVQIHRWACNKRDAGPDTTGAASVKRHTPDRQRPLLSGPERRDRGKLGSFGKPEGYVSKLSKQYRDRVKARIGK